MRKCLFKLKKKKKESTDSLRQKQILKPTMIGQGKTGKWASSSINQCLVNRDAAKKTSDVNRIQ